MKLPFTFLTLLLLLSTYSQVDKQIIVEHFTNTLCSVCATKNPDLNSNLSNYPEAIRISYHPSSPYSSCLFNQHNITGNDDRTNQYGVYGATPRLVIQGTVISPSQNFDDPNLISNYEGEFSPVLLNTYIDSITVDSVYVSVVAKTVAILSNSYPILYTAIVEDTINYNAPNGETQHYSVFRKALNGNEGLTTSLPSTIGDSVVYTFKTKNHLDWNLAHVGAISILQNSSDLSVIQSSISGVININNSTIEEQEGDEGFDVHFNGTSNQLTILKENCRVYNKYEIYSLDGKPILIGNLEGNLTYVRFDKYAQGIYLIRLYNKVDQKVSKGVKFIK